MTRVAFKMKLKNASCIQEYKKRHDEIWPEILELLKEGGISDYSIFYDEQTLSLFAVQKVSGEGGSQDLGAEPAVQKWWNYMADLMETEENNAPISIPLREVFRME